MDYSRTPVGKRVSFSASSGHSYVGSSGFVLLLTDIAFTPLSALQDCKDRHHQPPSKMDRRHHQHQPPLSLFLLLSTLAFLLLHRHLYTHPHLSTTISTTPTNRPPPPCEPSSHGQWIRSPTPRRPLYDSSCPFHRNAWNCLRNRHPLAPSLPSWEWLSSSCPQFEPNSFLRALRGRRIGFVGDSLNENFLVAFLCSLRSADPTAARWKRKGSWRGAYFPRFDVLVAYHRAVLLAKYQWQAANQSTIAMENGFKGIYRVDVDVPADDWANITTFYDVLVFNTGHWWGFDKFPEETPLVFFKEGKPIIPLLGLHDGLKLVLESMVHYIQSNIPENTIKFWRTQSPRHFHGGEWNQNGTCLFNEPLKKDQLDTWFDPKNGGVNKEAREVNYLISKAIQGTDIHLLNLTYLSEFRADAHPAIWLGKKDAVAIWGQDCMHWCLPGLPDTWVDILSAQIMYFLGQA